MTVHIAIKIEDDVLKSVFGKAGPGQEIPELVKFFKSAIPAVGRGRFEVSVLADPAKIPDISASLSASGMGNVKVLPFGAAAGEGGGLNDYI
jgi:hypothetical protein